VKKQKAERAKKQKVKIKRTMKHFRLSHICAIFASLMLLACSSYEEENAPTTAKDTPMTFSVKYPGQTRVAGNAFESGDKIGLFVAEAAAPLEIGGNLVNNEAITFNGTSWAASRTLYWDEGTYNAYAYYPGMSSVSSIEDLPFNVSLDQSGDGYEASDFLHAKTTGVSASSEPVSLTFKHIMSKLSIRLVKGEDFEGDMPDEAQVYIHNTYPASTIDISAGVATVNGRGDRQTITAKADGEHQYSVIIVPQRVSNRVPLIEVVMKGVSYLYESTFRFKAGMNHFVNLVVTDNPDKVKIEIGGEVQDWQ